MAKRKMWPTAPGVIRFSRRVTRPPQVPLFAVGVPSWRWEELVYVSGIGPVELFDWDVEHSR